jgi:hypothetical protein
MECQLRGMPQPRVSPSPPHRLDDKEQVTVYGFTQSGRDRVCLMHNLPLAASPQSSSRVTVCHRITSILTSGPGSMLPTRSRVAEVSKCSGCLIRTVLSTSTELYMCCE